ncbi:MAG TPA: FCD domain-containing protein, partial [Gemmatimonadaceae bacterium]|nr:FCD domain-containing protein [Gemmatimonadaceae bacterium]
VSRGKEPRLTIAPLTQDDARELFGIIGAVEGFAAAEAAERARPVRDALVAVLHELNTGLAKAADARRPDPLRLFDLDMSFHRRYVEAGAGPRLLALHDAIKPQAERYIRLYTNALVDEIVRSVAEHEKIIEQIDAGNADGAQRAVQRNWRNATIRLSSVIDTVGERGSW